jgi:hypothetical protein
MKGRLTVFASSSGPLAKRWSLVDGAPQKTTAAQMTRGLYGVKSFGSVVELGQLLEKVTTQQAISASLPNDGSLNGEVVTARELAAHPGSLTRSKQHFRLKGPGVGVIDCDEAGYSSDELWSLLLQAAPALIHAGVIWRPSGSSHIFHGEQDLTGLRGQHLFVMVEDVADWPRVLKVLAGRLWLAGKGKVLVSKAGSLLLRCPVDLAVSDPARLIFCGGAVAEPPLEQRRGAPVLLSDGGFLDTASAIPDLSHEELGRCDALVSKAKAEAAPEAAMRQKEHRAGVIAERLPEMMARGLSATEAEKVVGEAVDAALAGTLLGDLLLTVVHGDGRKEVVTINRVLSDPDRYHEADCLDPLNPEHRGGSADARLYLYSSSPILYSLDDGGKVYRLRRQKQRLAFSTGNRVDLVEQLVRVAAVNDSVFLTDTGPILLDQGRFTPLTAPRLMNLLGREVCLVRSGKEGRDNPFDLSREVAELVLSGLYR